MAFANISLYGSDFVSALLAYLPTYRNTPLILVHGDISVFVFQPKVSEGIYAFKRVSFRTGKNL